VNDAALFPHDFRCLSVGSDAPPDLRARLAIARADVADVLGSARREIGLRRAVLLSTCHRTELYVDGASTLEPVDAFVAWWARARGVRPEELDRHATRLSGEAAVRHLMRVACGLDSPVLGEAEILSQVASAAHVAVGAHAVTPTLKRIFRSAVVTGERARREVWRGFPRMDIGSLAVEVALQGRATPTDENAVLVLGAGHAASLVARACQRRGVPGTITNRTDGHAQDLALRHGAHWHPWERLDDALDAASVVIVATAAPGPVLDFARISATQRRRPRALTLVDLAVPCNVDAAAARCDGTTLVGLDALHLLESRSRDIRLAAIPVVERLIDAQLADLPVLAA
jgi:glutamyl-tRNA reductase